LVDAGATELDFRECCALAVQIPFALISITITQDIIFSDRFAMSSPLGIELHVLLNLWIGLEGKEQVVPTVRLLI
jgi:hypothetical protein